MFNDDYVIVEVNYTDESQRRLQVAQEIEEYISTPIIVHNQYHESEKDLDSWYLEPDGSIDVNDPDSDIGVELVTPVFYNTRDALESLGKLLSVIEKIGYTNESTGLHVNISFTTPATIQPLKLVLFMGENYIAKTFGREITHFAQQHLKTILNSLIRDKQLKQELENARASGDVKRMESLLTQVIEGKHRTVHFKDDYLEFRVLGGTDYHKRYNEIKSSILRFLYAMYIATNEEVERKTYLKKLVKVISQSSQWIIDVKRDEYDIRVKEELSLFNSLYNSNDQKTVTFYHRVKDLLNAFYTSNFSPQDYKMLVRRFFISLLDMGENLTIFLNKLTPQQIKVLRRLVIHTKITKDELNLPSSKVPLLNIILNKLRLGAIVR